MRASLTLFSATIVAAYTPCSTEVPAVVYPSPAPYESGNGQGGYTEAPCTDAPAPYEDGNGQGGAYTEAPCTEAPTPYEDGNGETGYFTPTPTEDAYPVYTPAPYEEGNGAGSYPPSYGANVYPTPAPTDSPCPDLSGYTGTETPATYGPVEEAFEAQEAYEKTEYLSAASFSSVAILVLILPAILLI